MNINGKKIKQLRESKKLSRFDLSLECNISPSIIEKVENGQRSGLCVAFKLSEFFNVTIENLLEK